MERVVERSAPRPPGLRAVPFHRSTVPLNQICRPATILGSRVRYGNGRTTPLVPMTDNQSLANGSLSVESERSGAIYVAAPLSEGRRGTARLTDDRLVTIIEK